MPDAVQSTRETTVGKPGACGADGSANGHKQLHRQAVSLTNTDKRNDGHFHRVLTRC